MFSGFAKTLSASWPGSSRPSTSFFVSANKESKQDVDARHKAGHDGVHE
jgi:hypothetical protein